MNDIESKAIPYLIDLREEKRDRTIKAFSALFSSYNYENRGWKRTFSASNRDRVHLESEVDVALINGYHRYSSVLRNLNLFEESTRNEIDFAKMIMMTRIDCTLRKGHDDATYELFKEVSARDDLILLPRSSLSFKEFKSVLTNQKEFFPLWGDKQLKVLREQSRVWTNDCFQELGRSFGSEMCSWQKTMQVFHTVERSSSIEADVKHHCFIVQENHLKLVELLKEFIVFEMEISKVMLNTVAKSFHEYINQFLCVVCSASVERDRRAALGVVSCSHCRSLLRCCKNKSCKQNVRSYHLDFCGLLSPVSSQ